MDSLWKSKTRSFHFQGWKRLKSRQLFYLILLANALAVSFEGYAQGVLGGVNSSPDFIRTMDLSNVQDYYSPQYASDTKTIKLGGVTAVYYFGALWGAIFAGWIADKLGRRTGLQLGCLWCMLGTALEAGAQNTNMYICARVIAGLGVGHMNVIAPTWTSEVSESAHRGKSFALVFLTNYGNIALAYWIGFGLRFIDHGYSSIRWRLAFAIQAIFPLCLFCLLPILPESPRFLLTKHKDDKALEVLAHVRANGDATDPAVIQEFEEVKSNVRSTEDEKYTDGYWPIITGRGTGKLHFGRRAQLALWLPLMTQIGTGISATTIYTPTLVSAAGWGDVKSNWLSALNNTVGIGGTVIAMYIIDPLGRRKSLLIGSLAQSGTMWIIGAMSICTISYPNLSPQYGAASVSFIYVFTLIYSSTYLIINFNYPAEIFPTEVRARGMALGITGWAIGLGCGALYNPVLFQNMGGKGFFIFAGLNLLFFILVFLFLPETSGRSLEAINVLFETNNPLNYAMEKRYQEFRQQERAASGDDGGDYQEKMEVEEVGGRGDALPPV